MANFRLIPLSIEQVQLAMPGMRVPTHTVDGYNYNYAAIKCDNEIIGAMNFNFFKEEDESLVLYLREIAIDDSFRGKGLGKGFISYFIKFVKSDCPHPVTAIELEADDSYDFWIKCGFIPTGEISKDNLPRMQYKMN